MSTEKVLQQDEGFTGTRYATSATTLVKTGAGMLKAISINKRPPGTLSIYDTATATGSLGSGSLKAVLDSSSTVRVAELNLTITKGIVVVASVTGGDWLILYR